MKRLMLLLVVGIVVFNVALVGAAEPYLKPSATKMDRTQVNPGDPVVAEITLEKLGIIPETATLKYVTDLTSPDISVWIDDAAEPERYGVTEYEIALPSDGVRKIQIRITGNAPEVSTFTTAKVIEITTTVLYKGEELEDQDSGKITVRVSTEEITASKGEIDEAWDLFAVVNRKITALQDQGVAIGTLGAELEDARVQINTAEALFDQGDQELALSNAESAVNRLNNIDREAAGLQTETVESSDVQRYLVIAAAVIIVFVVLLLFKSKREELG